VLLILVAGIGLRVFKGVYTGIVYDESATYGHFARSYRAAWTSYENPNNNHVINSLLMNVCRQFFGTCPFFYRLHTMTMSILYCLSIAYLVWALVNNPLLRVLLTALLVFQSFVLDLSYLARGYSIALAAFYGGFALLVMFLRRTRPFSRAWMPIVILVLMNFITLGSMLSAMTLVFAFNISYMLFVSHRAFASYVKWVRSFAVHICVVGLASAALLYMLYCHIWRDILAARENFGKTRLWEHLVDVLWSSIFVSPGITAKVAYGVFLAATAVAVLHSVLVMVARRQSARSLLLTTPAPELLVLSTTVVVVVVIYLYRNVAGLSLGFARNGVFLIPLFFLACGVLIDNVSTSAARMSVRRLVVGLACASLTVTLIEARPALYAVKVSDWSYQSACGPLVRQLKSIDPSRRWTMGVTSKTSPIYLSFRFYQERGFLAREALSEFDVRIYHVSDTRDTGRLYRPEFFRVFDCQVILSDSVIEQYRIRAADLSPG